MFKERNLIAHIRRLAVPSAIKAVTQGIGDDCAILRPAPGSELLVTTDLCIENVHFRRVWHPAASVGHRCLTRGLSDIAAMGGAPLACFLSLGLPKAGISQAGATQKEITQNGSINFCKASSLSPGATKSSLPAVIYPPLARSLQTSLLSGKPPLAKPSFAPAPALETEFT